MHNNSKVMDLMKDPGTVLIFDIDGVLVSYNYGEYTAHHEYDIKGEGDWSSLNLYTADRCFPSVRDFIQRHGTSNVYCLSQEPFGREDQKTALMSSYYGIAPDHCHYVKSQEEKLPEAKKILQSLHILPDPANENTQEARALKENENAQEPCALKENENTQELRVPEENEREALSAEKVPCPYRVVMIDDNSETLRRYDETGLFATAHVSIFLESRS
ncbi:MAG: hypothetical protein K6E33_08680 [Lachnospiraceae bacterium]|nr:hypothetical protein [Lachnospiraceae bacterium]